MLEPLELALPAEAVVVTTGVTIVVTTWEVLVPETKLEVVTSVVGDEVVMMLEDDVEVVEVVVVGLVEVVDEVDEEVEVVVGVDAVE